MSCAYGDKQSVAPKVDRQELSLPIEYSSNGLEFSLDTWQESDVEGLFRIFEKVIIDGQSYPQETTSIEEFRQYFLSKYCFVVNLKEYEQKKVVAGFYIKPNFPGRSSHLANYGLLVHHDYRGHGLGKFMTEQCVRLARILGFGALYTNLVYANNHSSIKICQRLGFEQVGRVPKAGRLKNLGYVDALQFYLQLTNESSKQ